MQQVLFWIPITIWNPHGIPVYGYGMMLFLAFIVCTWLAGRRAEREEVGKEVIQDLAIWVFLGGLLGSRIVYLLTLPEAQRPYTDVWGFIKELPRIWDGGVVFYGGAIGGVVGYFLDYLLFLRKQGVSTLQMADIVAPSVAVGLCLGRIGCLLNGCCYGQVACAHCPAIHFPLAAPVRFALVEDGYQTAAGFTLVRVDSRVVKTIDPDAPPAKSGLLPGDRIVKANGTPILHGSDLHQYLQHAAENKQEVILTVERNGRDFQLKSYQPRPGDDFLLYDDRVVDEVEPDSAASQAGLARGDTILKANDREIDSYGDLAQYLGSPDSGGGCNAGGKASGWPRGKNNLTLTVRKPSGEEQVLTFAPKTLGVQPTQLYESISMFLIFLLLTTYYPLRRHPGEVMALLMMCYGVHRYLNELLRIDKRPEGFESYISVLLVVSGLVLFLWLRFRPAATATRTSK
jgi:prolipoprotein diacylglyceryltransferase